MELHRVYPGTGPAPALPWPCLSSMCLLWKAGWTLILQLQLTLQQITLLFHYNSWGREVSPTVSQEEEGCITSMEKFPLFYSNCL